MKYTAYIFDNGAYQERFKVELNDNITTQEAEEMLNTLQVHTLRSDKDIIESYKVNNIWYTFIVNTVNTLNKQLVDLCNKLKVDIEATGVNPRTKYNYKYNPDFGCHY